MRRPIPRPIRPTLGAAHGGQAALDTGAEAILGRGDSAAG